MSKKLEQKQQRRLAEERKKQEAQREKRRKNLLTLLIALVVVASVAALVVSDRQQEAGPIGVAAAEANCGPKEEVEATGNQHIDPGTSHEEYNSDPPTNGPHYGVSASVPAPPDFYVVPLEPEVLVHNLEHGQIVIWYSPDAPEQVKDDLEAIVADEPGATVAAPYEGADDYNFYLTAWNKLPGEDEKDDFGTGYLQGCDLVSQEVIDDFRREHQGRSPEPITPLFEG